MCLVMCFCVVTTTKVSEHLQYFIRKKLKEDAAWRGLRVVFSGPEVPGEGEHKIMTYIRDAKAQKDYDPDTRHCMYGQVIGVKRLKYPSPRYRS